MTKIIAIIGDGGTGKSTLIRHITGVARTRDITLTPLSGRNVSVHVRPQSPQEPPTKILPPQLCRLIVESGAEYAIIVLRIDAINIAPGYQKYLQAFRGEGFVIKHVIQLGRKDRLPEVEISNHHDGLLPNNQVAAAITNMIGFF